MTCSRNSLQFPPPAHDGGGRWSVPVLGLWVWVRPESDPAGLSSRPFLPPPLHVMARASRTDGGRGAQSSSGREGTLSNHEVVVVGRTEGSCSQNVQGVHQDQSPREVFPTLGDGVFHLVQAYVQLLDDIPVAVPDLVAPG